VLARRPRVALGLVDNPVTLDRPAARLLFANTVSLLPGTLAADPDGGRLRVHARDLSADCQGELRRLEAAVGRIFGETL
jgi:multicomponent Na+:H+ antiporter subunit E